MNSTDNKANVYSFDELLEAIEASVWSPNDTAWAIYHYLMKNYARESSEIVRRLLAAYLKLQLERPSLIHSCMLAVAVKASETFCDFNFPAFLEYWGFPKLLRKEDSERQKAKDGRTFLPLAERAERRRDSWLLHHGASKLPDNIRSMFAVKVFEKEKGPRRLRFAKLVGGDGLEVIAESHMFPYKPWEIQGRMFDVLTRTSASGEERAVEIAAAKRNVEQVFPPVAGYVDGIDEGHGHCHIYDASSRHFVAERPTMKLSAGTFVMFSPIVPAVDKFKTACVTEVLTKEEGLRRFGWYEAEVTYANTAEGYFRYKILSPIAKTPEGTVEEEAFAPVSCISNSRLATSLHSGMKIGIVMFLKRGIDKTKRNHVAEAFIAEKSQD